MEQRRVSFRVAKAIKEAGYPQYNQPITEIGWYNKAGVYTNQLPTFWKGDDMFVAVAPTYLDVWLWLWREKGVIIKITQYTCYVSIGNKFFSGVPKKDPEEAIIAAIDDLVDNDLIK